MCSWHFPLGDGEMRCHPTMRPLWYEGRLMLVGVRGQCETDVNVTRGPGVSGMTSRPDIVIGPFDLACRSSPGPQAAGRGGEGSSSSAYQVRHCKTRRGCGSVTSWYCYPWAGLRRTLGYAQTVG